MPGVEALGLDSLGLVEAIFALEEAFGISVPFNANEPDGAGVRPLDRGLGIVAGCEGLIASSMMRRVVITGAGTVNALAHDVPGTLAALRAGRCGIGPLDLSRCRPADDPDRRAGAGLAPA